LTELLNLTEWNKNMKFALSLNSKLSQSTVKH